MKDIIILPTYNERENVGLIIPLIFKYTPDIHVVVVDDNSPDGTADNVRKLMTIYPHVSLISRDKKEGLGRAYIHAFREVLVHEDVQSIIMMDADLSHDPSVLLELIRLSRIYDVVVGSRYIRGGGTIGWELWRRLLSRYGNIYCRMITRMGIHDCTGGFNMIRADMLRKIDFDNINSSGYAFAIELKYRLYTIGAKFIETPIIFKNRINGESKISNHVISEGIWAPLKMVWRKGTIKR